jgi:hypothetical protein
MRYVIVIAVTALVAVSLTYLHAQEPQQKLGPLGEMRAVAQKLAGHPELGAEVEVQLAKDAQFAVPAPFKAQGSRVYAADWLPSMSSGWAWSHRPEQEPGSPVSTSLLCFRRSRSGRPHGRNNRRNNDDGAPDHAARQSRLFPALLVHLSYAHAG